MRHLFLRQAHHLFFFFKRKSSAKYRTAALEGATLHVASSKYLDRFATLVQVACAAYDRLLQKMPWPSVPDARKRACKRHGSLRWDGSETTSAPQVRLLGA
jgi:hypothetical protein